MNTKNCRKCNITKDHEEFYNNRRLKDGKCSYCKVCTNKISKDFNKTEKGRENLYKIQKKYRISSGKQPEDKPLTTVQINRKLTYCERRIDELKTMEHSYNNIIDDSFDELHKIDAKIKKYELAISVFDNMGIVEQLLNN
jgi:hypothetical protein